MTPTVLTPLLDRMQTAEDCHLDASRLALDGDLAAAAAAARSSAEAYADAAEICVELDAGNPARARLYVASAEKVAAVAVTVAELATLAGAGGLDDSSSAAGLALRAVRRARIAVDPHLDDSDFSTTGLAAAARIGEAFSAVSDLADEAQKQAGRASDLAEECERTVTGQDAMQVATQARVAASAAARAAGRAQELAPGAYSAGATAAPDCAGHAVAAAVAADRAATGAEDYALTQWYGEKGPALRAV